MFYAVNTRYIYDSAFEEIYREFKNRFMCKILPRLPGDPEQYFEFFFVIKKERNYRIHILLLLSINNGQHNS